MISFEIIVRIFLMSWYFFILSGGGEIFWFGDMSCYVIIVFFRVYMLCGIVCIIYIDVIKLFIFEKIICLMLLWCEVFIWKG